MKTELNCNMVKIGDMFGNYLKTSDIEGDMTVQISHVKVEELGRDEKKDKKAVVYFKDLDKGLALNKINAEVLEELCGSDETDDWLGIKVILYVDPNVYYGGEKKGGVRVKEIPTSQEEA